MKKKSQKSERGRGGRGEGRTDQGNYDIASIVPVKGTLALRLRKRIDSREILAVASHHWKLLLVSWVVADGSSGIVVRRDLRIRVRREGSRRAKEFYGRVRF